MTFKEYLIQTRQQMLERKYTSRNKKYQFGQIDKTHNIYQELYPWSVRKRMLRNKMFMLLYHVALTCYIFTLIFRFRKGWKIDCVRHMNIFLVVYAVFEVILTGA